jgi:hypothetical protein
VMYTVVRARCLVCSLRSTDWIPAVVVLLIRLSWPDYCLARRVIEPN